MIEHFSVSSSGGSASEPCSCKHERDDHISSRDGMLPLCIFCGCTGWRPVPFWVKEIMRHVGSPE